MVPVGQTWAGAGHRHTPLAVPADRWRGEFRPRPDRALHRPDVPRVRAQAAGDRLLLPARRPDGLHLGAQAVLLRHGGCHGRWRGSPSEGGTAPILLE